MSLLEMNHIKKEFGGVPVIKDISLSVEQGEILAIIGPSGSGKSTLLRCATMLETIDDGEILYLGQKAAWVEHGKPVFPKKQELKDIQSYFGLVFQNFNLFPHFSVIKNITDAPIKVQKRNKEEVYEEAKKLLAKMGLEDKADAKRRFFIRFKGDEDEMLSRLQDSFGDIEIVKAEGLEGEFGFVTPVMMEGDYVTRANIYREQILHMIRVEG